MGYALGVFGDALLGNMFSSLKDHQTKLQVVYTCDLYQHRNSKKIKKNEKWCMCLSELKK